MEDRLHDSKELDENFENGSMGCFRVNSQWQSQHVEHGRAAGEPQYFASTSQRWRVL